MRTVKMKLKKHKLYRCLLEACSAACPTFHIQEDTECIPKGETEVSYNLVTYNNEVSNTEGLNEFKLIKSSYANVENNAPIVR